MCVCVCDANFIGKFFYDLIGSGRGKLWHLWAHYLLANTKTEPAKKNLITFNLPFLDKNNILVSLFVVWEQTISNEFSVY